MNRLTKYLEDHPDIEIAIFAGKGGLGKTTCSAAFSHYMATAKKRKTLCFSTDPQASLSDIFERNFFGQGIVELEPNLSGVEIDADRRVREYQEDVKQKIRTMYGLDEIPAEIDEYIDSTSAEPAMYESATYDAMAELVAAKSYDLYVFDMPPFGHGVRMVAMADILTQWVEKITEARKASEEYEAVAATLKGQKAEEDQVMTELLDIRSKIKNFTDLITNRSRTAFLMVIIPEKMAILDTERAIRMFEDLHIQLSGIIVNQVYPVELLGRDGLTDFLRSRIEMQQEHVREIQSKFGDLVLATLPMLTKEPKGFPMIAEVAEALFRR